MIENKDLDRRVNEVIRLVGGLEHFDMNPVLELFKGLAGTQLKNINSRLNLELSEHFRG